MTFYQIYSYTYSLLFVNKNVSLGFIKKNIYIQTRFQKSWDTVQIVNKKEMQ